MKIFNTIPTEPTMVTPDDVISVELMLLAGDNIQVTVETPKQDFILSCWFSSVANGKPIHQKPFHESEITIGNTYPLKIKPRTAPYNIPYGKVFLNIRNKSGDETDAEVLIYKETT